MRYHWTEKDDNTVCLQQQRNYMAVRQGRRETLFTLHPFISSTFRIINADLCVFPPLGYTSFSLPCLYEETKSPLPTPASPPPPPTLLFKDPNP